MNNLFFQMLLTWARFDSTDYTRGMTDGWIMRDQSRADQSRIEPWQAQYIENIARARQNGVSA